jgi:hypothetical protein
MHGSRTIWILGLAACWAAIGCTGDEDHLAATSDGSDAGGDGGGTTSGSTGGGATGSGGESVGVGGGGTSSGSGGGSTVEPLFASDWSTALGSSHNAVSDGGRWTMVGGQGGEIVASTGLDFPTANVLRVPWNEGWSLPRKTGMPIPAVGESRYYRWYMHLAFPDNVSDGQSHPIQDGEAGSQINWELAIRHNDGGPGAFVAQYQLHTVNGWPNYVWNGPTLQKGVTYRYELHLYRDGEDTFQIHPRIYDSSGTLIAADEDFSTYTNSATLASNPSLLFNDVNNLDGLNAGCNQGSLPEVGIYGYQAGFCVRADTWCGPYAGGI